MLLRINLTNVCTLALLISCFTANMEGSNSRSSICCHQVNDRQCRRACEKVVRGKRGFRKLKSAVKHCPSTEVDVWKCMNATLQSHRAYRLEGGTLNPSSDVCCPLAENHACQTVCVNAGNNREVETACKNERKVLNCLKPKSTRKVQDVDHAGLRESCCNVVQNHQCRQACLDIVSGRQSMDAASMIALKSSCLSSPNVFGCVAEMSGKQSGLSVANQCCPKGKDHQCQDTCRKVFEGKVDPRSKVELLIKQCGIPLPQDAMWGCLLDSSAAKGKNARAIARDISATKAPNLFRTHCCSRARSSVCREWCNKVFSNPTFVDRQDSAYAACMENPVEQNLSSCVGDVLEPCKFGCQANLQFCTAFSNRPFDLFRRCDSRADAVAKSLFNVWTLGKISYRSMTIHVKDIRQCEPEKWKALACSTALKPCDRKSNNNQICRSDCIGILEKCLDKQRTPPYLTADKICSIFLPIDDQSTCVKIDRFTEPERRMDTPIIQLNLPCHGNPCKRGEMCVVKEECIGVNDVSSCPQHRCLPGCAVDSASRFVIAEKGLGKLLVPSTHNECYQVCQCDASDNAYRRSLDFVDCLDAGCMQRRKCRAYNTTYEHGDVFRLDCNLCTCFDEEMICTKRMCNDIRITKIIPTCNCPNEYRPVCGSDGVTYSNLCYALCYLPSGSTILPVPCELVNPCGGSPCPRGNRCMIERKSCLLSQQSCPQFKCISTEPLFTRSCTMMRDGRQKCVVKELQKDPCDEIDCPAKCPSSTKIETVCGYDAITYKSMCQAERHYTDVHYHGRCAQTKQSRKEMCRDVRCPKTTCHGPTPPGSCCPICGTVLRVLFSAVEIRHYTSITSDKPITTQSIVKHLRRHTSLGECRLTGYRTQYGDFAIIVQPRKSQPSPLQVDICRGDAEKILGWINTGSPVIITNYPLSVLKVSRFQIALDIAGSSNKRSNIEMSTLLLCLVIGLVSAFQPFHDTIEI